MTSSSRSFQDDNDHELETEADATEETIALFGGHGPTGKHFIKLALDAGYLVRALGPVDDLGNEQLTILPGRFNDSEAVEEVIQGATYVVCMLGETLPTKKKEYEPHCLTNFVKLLYPLMKEDCTRLFLYQASSLTVDTSGKSPVMASVLKRSSNLGWGNRAVQTQDHDAAVKFIGEQSNEFFDFIVTRPGLCRDTAPKKRLAASKSLPGPVPVANEDLADFSLGALKTEKLFNTCPYVVGDGF